MFPELPMSEEQGSKVNRKSPERKAWGGRRAPIASELDEFAATPRLGQRFSSPNTPEPIAKYFLNVPTPEHDADDSLEEEEVEQKVGRVTEPDGEGVVLLGTVEYRVVTLNGGTKISWREREVALKKATADLPPGSVMV